MTFLGVLGFIALMVVSTILRGIVLSILWGWFVFPLGLPMITGALALGIALLVSYMTDHDSKKEDRELGTAMALCVTQPLFVLLVGFIIHLFV